MIMTAQYRPYRDEDCVDGSEAEHIGWPDHEPGIQIYEKTTEDIPFTRRRRSLLMTILLCVLVGSVSFLVGFFSHSTHSECITNAAASLDAIRNEDPAIRGRLLSELESGQFARLVREFAAEPHIAGSDGDLRLASKIMNFFETHKAFERPVMRNYTARLPLPNPNKPNFVSLINNETGHEVYNSLNASQYLGGFSAYSPSGNVTGDLLFVNFGRLADYEDLQALYNSTEELFHGKILLAKQFHLAASEQYRIAQQMKAAALLLYPDPEHYNPKNEKPYPDSIWLPPDAVRSDAIFWNGAGDPETFGLPANSHAYVDKDWVQFSGSVSIPAQPISYETAQQILQQLDGKDVPFAWKGGSNVTYKVGPKLKGNLKVHVNVNNEMVNRTITNVVGTIRGRVEPDRYVIIGNQRDSITNGAADSASGTAVFLELARVFSSLVQEGWKPRRSILFCSWGAEEFNLLGSTEWIEEMGSILHTRAVAYININKLVTGCDSLDVAASPLLYHVIYNATKEVLLPKAELDQRPEGFASVYDKWLSSKTEMRNHTQLILYPSVAEHLDRLGLGEQYKSTDFHNDPHHFHREESNEPGGILKSYVESASQELRPRIRPLDMYGSSAPFYSMAGIPSIDLAFVRHNHGQGRPSEQDEFESIAFTDVPYPLLHTQYDQVKAIEKFVDPEYKCHKMAAQILAEVTRDLTDSLFLPFNLFDYAQLLRDVFVKSNNLRIIVARYHTEHGDHDVPAMTNLNMDPLESAITNFTNAAIVFHARQDKVDLRDPMAIRRINDQLQMLERQFLDYRGIPSNNYKRHLILSPAEAQLSPQFELDGVFPALLDELDELSHMHGSAHQKEIDLSVMRLNKHLPILINTIQSAADLLAE